MLGMPTCAADAHLPTPVLPKYMLGDQGRERCSMAANREGTIGHMTWETKLYAIYGCFGYQSFLRIPMLLFFYSYLILFCL